MNDGAGPPSLLAARRPNDGRRNDSLFLRLIDWFVPDAYLHPDKHQLRSAVHVFAASVLLSGPVTFVLGLVAFAVVPPEFAPLAWLTVSSPVFLVFPFLVKWTGRLDVVATALVQTMTLAVLTMSHFFGGIVSPVLPWLLVAFTAVFYYLTPWPRLRTLNLVAFGVEVVAYTAAHLYVLPPTRTASDHDLLVMLFASSMAVFIFIELILWQVWAMNLAKQRGLRREVDVRRAVEAELRTGREHLARAQAVGRIGSAERNLAGGSTRWSSEHYRLLGLSPETPGPVDELLMAAVHPDDRTVVEAVLERERLGALAAAVEFRIVRPDGEVRWLRRQPEFMRDQEGKPVSLLVTVQDITSARQAEEERVGLERRLLQSQKLEAIGKLAGGVAHDFNNLLAVIVGRMEMVEEELIDQPEVRGWVQSAIRAAERGKNLTRMMLSFARRQPLQPSEIDPSAMFRELTDILGRTLGDSIEIKLVATPEPWRCEADPGQLHSALLNLAVNARDAMPHGGTLTMATENVRLDDEAATRAGAQPGEYVLMSVADTGVGMRPEVLEHVFEPFFTTKEMGRGTGLGLSMVSGFVAQSGGHIAIASEIGRGTTVGIYLPRKGGNGSSPDAAAPLAARTRASRKAILVVEDDDEVREIAHTHLERQGYRVIAAASGADGLEALRRHPEVALLLCDLALGVGMDGVELARHAAVMQPELKVVFMSGYSSRIDLPSLGAAAKPHLLYKPFQRGELVAEIRAALGED